MLPILSESILDEIDEGQPRQGDPHDYIHPSLRKLHAAGYQGTFLKAYNILTKIAASIGWDQLLKIRSEVFVMEEEYRVERQHSTPKPGSSSIKAQSVAEQSTSETNGNGNGEQANNQQNDSSIERPEHTIASEVVKSGNEDVGPLPSCFESSPTLY